MGAARPERHTAKTSVRAPELCRKTGQTASAGPEMKRCELEMENDSPRLWGVLQCIRAIFGKKIVSRGQEERNGKREMRHNRCFPPEAVTRELKMERHFPKDAGNLRPPPISLSYSFFYSAKVFLLFEAFLLPFSMLQEKASHAGWLAEPFGP